jgi:hypothetical protein
MGCNCGQRRNLTAQAMNNIRKGDVAAAKQNAQRFVQTVRQDARKLGNTVRSTLNIRPPSR